MQLKTWRSPRWKWSQRSLFQPMTEIRSVSFHDASSHERLSSNTNLVASSRPMNIVFSSCSRKLVLQNYKKALSAIMTAVHPACIG